MKLSKEQVIIYLNSLSEEELQNFSIHEGKTKYHPKWKPNYVYKDGKQLGPFLYSTKWTKLDFLEELFFNNDKEFWVKKLKEKAYNKTYEPPEEPMLLAKAIKDFLVNENKELQKKVIELSKEISKLKREKNEP